MKSSKGSLCLITIDVNNKNRYDIYVIKSFKCKETYKLFQGEYTKKFHKNIQRKILQKLLILDASMDLNDLRIPPGNCLEALKGNRYGQYSIRINDRLRICFNWNKGHAFNVEVVDYH